MTHEQTNTVTLSAREVNEAIVAYIEGKNLPIPKYVENGKHDGVFTEFRRLGDGGIVVIWGQTQVPE